jgi:hypothetical protein
VPIHGGRGHPADERVSAVSKLHCDWRNDIESLGNLFSTCIPVYHNLITSYMAKKPSSAE